MLNSKRPRADFEILVSKSLFAKGENQHHQNRERHPANRYPPHKCLRSILLVEPLTSIAKDPFLLAVNGLGGQWRRRTDPLRLAKHLGQLLIAARITQDSRHERRNEMDAVDDASEPCWMSE